MRKLELSVMGRRDSHHICMYVCAYIYKKLCGVDGGRQMLIKFLARCFTQNWWKWKNIFFYSIPWYPHHLSSYPLCVFSNTHSYVYTSLLDKCKHRKRKYNIPNEKIAHKRSDIKSKGIRSSILNRRQKIKKKNKIKQKENQTTRYLIWTL